MSESTVGFRTGGGTLFHQWGEGGEDKKRWEIEVIHALPDSQFLDKVESKWT